MDVPKKFILYSMMPVVGASLLFIALEDWNSDVIKAEARFIVCLSFVSQLIWVIIFYFYMIY